MVSWVYMGIMEVTVTFALCSGAGLPKGNLKLPRLGPWRVMELCQGRSSIFWYSFASWFLEGNMESDPYITSI